MLHAREVELGFVDLSPDFDGNELAANAVWSAEVVVVSPPGTKLSLTVPVDELATLRLVLPQEGTPRRMSIDGMLTSASGRKPSPALATDERSAWITSAKQGIGSFLCYRAVASELEGVEIRALDPPHWIDVGFVHRAEPLSEEGRDMLQLAAECPLPSGCRAPSDV